MIHWLCAGALAFDVPPFDPDQHVVRVPPDLAFRTVAVDRVVAGTERPTYVIVAAEVVDGPAGSTTSFTEQAIDTVWYRWSLDPRFDPTVANLALLSLDEREVRLRAGTTWDAEFGFGPERVGTVIDHTFLPLAKVGDLDGGLAAMVVGLDDAVGAAIAARETRGVVLRSGVLALGVGAVGTVFTLLGLRIRRARERFRQALALREAVLARAEMRLADLGLSIELRDRIVALRVKGERTRALVAEVGERLDRLRIGLEALGRRTVAVEALPAGVSAAAWDRKTAALDAPFEIDTGEIGTTLFEPETRRVTITPATALAALEAEWDAARFGWTRVLDAVHASLRTAEADLTADDLERLIAELDEAGLPLTWLDDHPLRPESETTWARLDGLRVADPVAYLDALEQAIARDDALELRVARLVGGRNEVQRARAEAEATDLDGLDTVPLDPSEDPTVVARELATAVDTMDRALHGTDAGAAERAIDEALEVAHRLAGLKVAIRDAVATAAAELAAIEPRLRVLDAEVTAAAGEVRQVLERHLAPSVEGVLVERDQSTSGAEAALAAWRAARTALAGRHHLTASRWVREADRHHTATLQDLRELRDAVTVAEASRERAETLWEALGSIRHRHDRAVSAYGSYGVGLDDGDQRLATLRAEWDGPGDWRARLVAVQGVVEAWQAAEARARAAYDQEQRRQAAQARAVAAATARRSSHRSSGSGYRSTSSVRSSSGRSAGRSTASTGRSAGRRF